MRLPEPDEALVQARSVLSSCRADEAEVTLQHEAEGFVRYAPEGPTQCGDRERITLAVRARFREPGGGWREARATCSTLDPAVVRRTVERAEALARVAAPDPHRVPLGGPVELPRRSGAGALAAALEHGFDAKAEWVRRASLACRERDLAPAGLVRAGGRRAVLVNSAGREVQGEESRARFELTAFDPSGRGDAGMGEASHADVRALDPEPAIERAVSRAALARRPLPVEAGEYTVVLEPPAVASLLLFPCYSGFGAQEVQERSSFLCGRVGEQLFPAGLELHDDPLAPERPSLPFDGEGTPRCRTPLLAARALTGPVTDSAWAARLGVPNTAHATPQPSPDGPGVRHLVVRAGNRSREELVAGVDRGLLVSKLHYTNLIEPRGLTLTGMTRGGLLRIAGGEVREALCNLRFTQSLVEALRRVTGIGRDVLSSGALFDGEVLTPALVVDGFRFTSTTDF